MRVIVRACIPAWYTKGFNPHAKLVFSTPLSVGAQSVCEYLDIRIDREMSCDEIKDRLNAELTDELYITEAYIPKNDFSQISWSSYEIEINTADVDADMVGKAKQLLTTSPLVMLKKSKSGEKEVDIIPMIKSVDVYQTENKALKIKCLLSASSTVYLNPEMLISAAKERLGILSGDPTQESYSILRTNVYTDDGVTEFR
jgi:radical SAM-linked protein